MLARRAFPCSISFQVFRISLSVMAIGQSLADGRVRVLLIGFGKLNLELNGRYRSVGFGSGVGGVTSWSQHVTFGGAYLWHSTFRCTCE